MTCAISFSSVICEYYLSRRKKIIILIILAIYLIMFTVLYNLLKVNERVYIVHLASESKDAVSRSISYGMQVYIPYEQIQSHHMKQYILFQVLLFCAVLVTRTYTTKCFNSFWFYRKSQSLINAGNVRDGIRLQQVLRFYYYIATAILCTLRV